MDLTSIEIISTANSCLYFEIRFCHHLHLGLSLFAIFSSKDGGVTIETSTSPPNSVTVKTLVVDWYNDLEFEWNRNVSSTITSGSVRIGVPLDQLLLVQVQDGNNV